MRILLNGLTQRPGGGMVVLQGLVSGIANVSTTDEIVAIVYDDTVFACLQKLGFDNVHIIQASKINDLLDKLVVPYRARSAALTYECDVAITLNFYIPFLPIPQLVYHVDLERFEHHSVFPLSLHRILEKVRDSSARRALIKADANVFESHFVLNAAKEHCKVVIQRPTVVYIGIDSSSIKEGIETNGAGAAVLDNGLIVVVSSPLPYKNNEALVPVLAELIKQDPETHWRIRLFGGQNISVWSELADVADAYDVLDRFEFMGYQGRSTLNESLDVAVCQLNTSRLESFCMVALEAMARGCPVIVSSDAAMPESVGDAGLILDPGNTLAIVEKIILLNSLELARSAIEEKAIDWASQHTWEQSGRAFHELCYELSSQ